ncbi:MAG TPA: hypothetical protein VMY59_06075 [Candidatus Thermoplasmatota archaeon]|nr:hypothetical protein [Candidatus Thermoplasmatota archaeon]
MKRIKKKTTDSAVVGIVTAILLVGLVVTVISIIQVVYVPSIMKQREAEHMDKVEEQMASLTSVIDYQAAIAKKGIPIASFVTLGNRELPFFVSSKAFGTLQIFDNSSSVTINSTSIFPIGRITYSSTNAYYLDQSYSYEAGAMIVSQIQGNSMLVRPSFSVNFNETQNTTTISFDVINISSVAQKNMMSGFGTSPIQTEFVGISKNITFSDVESMTITTPFSNAWFIFINHSLIDAGLNKEGDPPQCLLNDTGQAVTVYFLSDPSSDFKVSIIFKIIEIQAQIGPGWVV